MKPSRWDREPRRYETKTYVRGFPVFRDVTKAAKVERRRKARAEGTASLRGRWTGRARIEYQREFGNNGRKNRKEEGGHL